MTRNLLSQKAVLASLNITGWTTRRLDKSVTKEVNNRHGASDDAGRYNKLLIAKTATEPLTTIASRARQEFYELSQPWLDTGARVLPSALYIDFSTKMRKHKADYDAAAEQFVRAYPDHVMEARKRLNGMFNPADYPSQSEVRKLFDLDVKIFPCPDAADFRVDIADEHAEDIRADIEARMRDALEAAMREPVERIVETVGHMAERLKAYKPAARKGERTEGLFRDSLVENVRSLAAVLPAFNLTNDPRLAAISERISRELCVVEPQKLRDDPKARKSVRLAAEAILADVNDFMA
ncbi:MULTISPECIES: hypothetical protein [unclassified Bradyrhizobium]|uniref:hypothetical protein n=1 Tax=unclassified Bradyrhizobium TaxID=2631580 RepID=UPI0028E2C1C5|nr:MULTISPECIES: hypothetical protein [unclassified Bradyrhizobium]